MVFISAILSLCEAGLMSSTQRRFTRHTGEKSTQARDMTLESEVNSPSNSPEVLETTPLHLSRRCSCV